MVNPYINSRNTIPPNNISQKQLRTHKTPILRSYLNKINAEKHPSPPSPLCKTESNTTSHFKTHGHGFVDRPREVGWLLAK